jgi:acetyl esterase/lipase
MPSKELETLVRFLKAHPARTDLTLQEQRAKIESARRIPLAGDIHCARADADGVPAEWITTPESDRERTILYLHGGGYTQCSVNTHREMISRLARASTSRALAIDYRLAPEHPFPAALEDALAAYGWLFAQGIDSSRIAVAGDSAGGGLAVALMLALRDTARPLPAAGVCLSPWLDLVNTGATDAIDDYERAEWQNVLQMTAAYLRDTDPYNPLASPLYADLIGLPPLLIQAGSADLLRRDSIRFAERAKEQGMDITLEIWPDMIHVWQMHAWTLPEGQQAIERIGDFIRGHTG